MSSQKLLGLIAAACFLSLIEQSSATSIRCPPNSVFECKPLCYNTCDNLNATSCKTSCTPQCHCREGFVFQSEDSYTCVPVSSCGVSCAPNMVFRECTRTPQETCETLGIDYRPSETCMPRCVCDDGYVLTNDSEPQCIKTKKCLTLQ
ncbi:mucin-6-like [Anomaloglossus baeobatrachus]|uniref:mucin-6-like n=1 Tax=Anomaloglossus baeobatrachus TaxID=238106 RepID=UPI003F4F9048